MTETARSNHGNLAILWPACHRPPYRLAEGEAAAHIGLVRRIESVQNDRNAGNDRVLHDLTIDKAVSMRNAAENAVPGIDLVQELGMGDIEIVRDGALDNMEAQLRRSRIDRGLRRHMTMVGDMNAGG